MKLVLKVILSRSDSVQALNWKVWLRIRLRLGSHVNISKPDLDRQVLDEIPTSLKQELINMETDLKWYRSWV